jgi:menaquinone-dependent protoporphyrinogen IX oxidase
MTKALVLYDSKYGNTKMVAEEVAKGLRSKGMEAELAFMEGFEMAGIEGYDVVAIGAPNHWGRATKRAKTFVKSLKGKNLEKKTFGFFDTCLKGE